MGALIVRMSEFNRQKDKTCTKNIFCLIQTFKRYKLYDYSLFLVARPHIRCNTIHKPEYEFIFKRMVLNFVKLPITMSFIGIGVKPNCGCEQGYFRCVCKLGFNWM